MTQPHRIERRPVARKPWLTEYRCVGGEWFRAANLYDAARKLQAAGITGEAIAYAAIGTPSFEGTIERWAGLQVIEPDHGPPRIRAYVELPFQNAVLAMSSDAESATNGASATTGPTTHDARQRALGTPAIAIQTVSCE